MSASAMSTPLPEVLTTPKGVRYVRLLQSKGDGNRRLAIRALGGKVYYEGNVYTKTTDEWFAIFSSATDREATK
jgi:hypothetical protein